MKRTKWHRIVAAAISLYMVMTLLPISALAEDADGNTVTVAVGGTETITVDGSYEAGGITVENKNIATAEVTGVATIPGTVTAEAAGSITGDQSYAISDGSGNYLSLDSGNNVVNTTDPAKATVWIVTGVTGYTGYYTITVTSDGTTYYLYRDLDDGTVGVSTANNYWQYNSEDNILYTYDNNNNYYYLSYTNGSWQFADSSSGSVGPYTITAEADTYTTTITVTGVAAGTTTLTVGDSVYTIEVTEPEDDPDISAATKRETVSLTVGETSKTYTVSGKDVSGSDSYKSFVTVNVDPSAASDSEAGLTSGMALVIGDGNGNYLKREGEKIVSVNSAENATVWTVGTQRSTVNGQVVATYYYLEDVEEYFLCSRYGTGTGAGQYNYELNVTNNPASKNFRRWEYSVGNGFSYSGYSLTYTGTGGWSLENNGASGAAAYSVTSTVTITGVSEGNTIVTVGDTTYSITVKAGSIDTSNPASQTGKPTDGMTIGQPFIRNTTGGSQYFRIPAIVTLSDGTLVAAADARWDTTADGGGLDTIVARSSDGGANWNYIFANYLGDNGNEHKGASTAFIDPALATDGSTVYMVVDLFPAGYALNGANAQPVAGANGFTEGGYLRLSNNNRSSYDYYLDGDTIYTSDGTAVEGYTVDEYFNIFGADGTNSNLFFAGSPYQVYPTNYLYLTSSTDAGKTWSVPTLINVKSTDEQTYLVGPGGGTVTSTGRIIFPCYTYTGGDGNTSVIYSDDKGKTWTRSGAVTEQTSEATVSEVTVGSQNYLYMFTRYGGYYVSNDNGTTWGAQQSVSDISYYTGCELSTLTYSKLIDGCPAIILSAPTSNRTTGKIFVGLVQSDGTINWKYTYAVNGSGTYQYSDLTELSDGLIGLLYEDGSASITYTTLSIETITNGAEIETDPEEVTIWLEVGDTVRYETNLSVTVASVTDSDIVSAEIISRDNTIPQVTGAQGNLGTATATYDGNLDPLSNSLYLFTANGGGYVLSSQTSDGVTVYMRLDSGKAGDPNSKTRNTVLISPSSMTNCFFIEENGEYLTFERDSSKLYFNQVTNVNTHINYQTAASLRLYRPASSAETASDEIPGYVQITGVDQIEDGGYYLIVALYESAYYVLHPSNDDTHAWTHVVKVNADADTATAEVPAVRATAQVEITGLTVGTSDVTVGSVTYHVNVSEPVSREQNVRLNAGESEQFEALGAVNPSVTVGDTDIASATVEDQTVSLTYQDTTGTRNGSSVDLSGALYTFLLDSSGTYAIYHEGVFMSIIYSGSPNSSANSPITVSNNGENTFQFYSDSSGYYLTFDGSVFDRSKETGGNASFLLYRPAKEGEDTSGSAVPGYIQLTDLSEIENGGEYLIVAERNGTYYALYPAISTTAGDMFAEITGTESTTVQKDVTKHILTITGLYPGTTDVKFGGVTYHVTVSIAGSVTVTVPLHYSKTLAVARSNEESLSKLRSLESSGIVSVTFDYDENGVAKTVTYTGLKEGSVFCTLTNASGGEVTYTVNVVPVTIEEVSLYVKDGPLTLPTVTDAGSDLQGRYSVKINYPTDAADADTTDVAGKSVETQLTLPDEDGKDENIASVALQDSSTYTAYYDIAGSRPTSGTDYKYQDTGDYWLNEALYTFDLNSDGTTYTVSNTTPEGDTVYLNLIKGILGLPNKTNAAGVTISLVKTGTEGIFYIKSASNDYTGYLYFYRSTSQYGYFDQVTTYSGSYGPSCEFMLFRRAEYNEDGSLKDGEDTSVIPSYVQVTSADEIEDGGQYLIVAYRQVNTEPDEGIYYALYPSIKSGTADKAYHVIQIGTSEELKNKEPSHAEVETVYNYTLTITGQNSGTVDYMVGTTIYRITVDPVATVTLDGNEDSISYHATLTHALDYAKTKLDIIEGNSTEIGGTTGDGDTSGDDVTTGGTGTHSAVVALLVDLEETSARVRSDITLDLAGHNLTFSEGLNVFGGLLDSVADGASDSTTGGILKVSDFAYTGSQTGEGVLPIYDSTAGGYRLYSYRFYGVGKLDKTPSSVRFCFRLVFNNRYAWDLLANENSGVTFYLETTVGESVATFEFPHDVINTIQNLVITQNKDQESVYIYVRVIGLENFPGQTVYAQPKLTAGGLYTDTATDPNNKMYYEIPAAE